MHLRPRVTSGPTAELGSAKVGMDGILPLVQFCIQYGICTRFPSTMSAFDIEGCNGPVSGGIQKVGFVSLRSPIIICEEESVLHSNLNRHALFDDFKKKFPPGPYAKSVNG